MSKRYVARVAVPRPFRRGRSRTDGAPVARGVATPPADGAVAPPTGSPEIGPPTPDVPTSPPPTAPRPDAPVEPGGAPGAAEAGPARGVATPPEPTGEADSTQMMQAPDVTAAIFVDRSGRRARTLRRVVTAVVLLALLLIVALWVSQGVDALGLPVTV
ncbi:MAG: hypothetical protein WA890_15995 [Micromonospora sp.]